MSILIDGYNLLHVTGIFGSGPASFRRSREALLDFLAAMIDPAELPRTTIVFDSSEAPPGLPRKLKHSGLTVHYASDYESADELLEELIRAETAPRKLTVVSSDHRVQRAAKRRKATAVDSDCWYADLVRAAEQRAESGAVETKPAGPLSNVEVQWWLDHFHARDLTEPTSEQIPPVAPLPRTPSSASAAAKRGNPARPAAKRVRKPAAKKKTDSTRSSRIPEDLRNPFPPGYAADVMRELGDEEV